MKQLLIDTNCLISYITDRNLLQQKVVAVYFEEAAYFKSEVIIINTVITELVYVLEKVYTLKSAKIREILKALIDTPGIFIDHEFNLEDILELWPQKIKDFGDAVLASCAKQRKIPLLTFDQVLYKQLSQMNIPVTNLMKKGVSQK